MKHKASIPMKLEDGWEPIINMKVNDFDLKASCDLDSSISIMPRRIYEMLDLPPLEDCYLDVPLHDNVKRNAWGVLMMFTLWLKMLMSLLISIFWMLNTMLLVLLLWEELFLELLMPSLI